MFLFAILFSLFYISNTNKRILHKNKSINNFKKNKKFGNTLINQNNMEEKLKNILIPDKFNKEYNLATRNNQYGVPCLREEIIDQDECGCCWAVAIVSCLESCYYMNILLPEQKDLIKLSLQQIIDCTSSNSDPRPLNKPNKGCDGGIENKTIENVFNLPYKICTDIDYPFTSHNDNSINYIYKDNCPQNEKCEETYITLPKFDLISFDVSEEYLKKALYLYGPLMVNLDFEHINYKKGQIFRNLYSLEETPGHALILTGWGFREATEDEIRLGGRDEYYWIIKNSHGIEYGNDGFLWVTMEKNEKKSSPISRFSWGLNIYRPCIPNDCSGAIINNYSIREMYGNTNSKLTLKIISYISNTLFKISLKLTGKNLNNTWYDPINKIYYNRIPFIDSDNNIINKDTKKKITDENNYYCENPLSNDKSLECQDKKWFYYEMDIDLPYIITDTFWDFNLNIYDENNRLLFNTTSNIYWYARIVITDIDISRNTIYFEITEPFNYKVDNHRVKIVLYIGTYDALTLWEPDEDEVDDEENLYYDLSIVKNYKITHKEIDTIGKYIFYYEFLDEKYSNYMSNPFRLK